VTFPKFQRLALPGAETTFIIIKLYIRLHKFCQFRFFARRVPLSKPPHGDYGSTWIRHLEAKVQGRTVGESASRFEVFNSP
jgi:hypothetical protein